MLRIRFCSVSSPESGKVAVPTRRHSSPTSGGSPLVQQRASAHSADCTRETMGNPQVQCIDRIVDMSVMTERRVPVTMQCQVPTTKRVQRTMSLTQVQHIDREVDVPVAMRDKLTDEESAREHLADSLRGTARGISRQVERQLQV